MNVGLRAARRKERRSAEGTVQILKRQGRPSMRQANLSSPKIPTRTPGRTEVERAWIDDTVGHHDLPTDCEWRIGWRIESATN
jgi:hypothetical protein